MSQPLKGLDLQFDVPVDQYWRRGSDGSDKRRTPDWDALEQRSAIMRDVSRLQRTLESIARQENSKVMGTSVPRSPPLGSYSPTLNSLSFRKRSLILDDDFSSYDEDNSSNYIDSDTDYSSNTSEILRAKDQELVWSPSKSPQLVFQKKFEPLLRDHEPLLGISGLDTLPSLPGQPEGTGYTVLESTKPTIIGPIPDPALNAVPTTEESESPTVSTKTQSKLNEIDFHVAALWIGVIVLICVLFLYNAAYLF